MNKKQKNRPLWHWLLAGLVLLCFLAPKILFASSTPNVPLSSSTYAFIDKLIAFGLVESAIYGQRPWSQNEVARLVALSQKRFDQKCDEEENDKSCPLIQKILENLKNEFPGKDKKKKVELHLIDAAHFEFRFNNSEFRTVPVNNGLGTLNVRAQAFSRYREGAHDVEGANFLLESDHWASFASITSLYVRPRWELSIDFDREVKARANLQNGYAKLNLGNFELLAGRDLVIWGHSPEGGVLASSNVRPMDMIKISNDNPFRLPWFFKHLGYHKYTFFVSHLGPEFIYKNALMYGFAASLKPASFIELGFEHQFTFGGSGAPDDSALDLFSEFFFHRRTGGRGGGANVGDHRFGFNLRFQIPQLRNMTAYAEGAFEDFGRESFFHQFTQQMAFQSGIYLPLLTSNGKNSLRLQYEHIPAAYGRHGQWTSGLTLNSLSRGSPFASQSTNLLAEWEHLFSIDRRLKVRALYFNNGNDQFSTTQSSTGGPNRVFKTVDNPQEHRFLMEGVYSWPMGKLALEPRLGYEFISNFNFQQDEDRYNILLGINLNYDFNL